MTNSNEDSYESLPDNVKKAYDSALEKRGGDGHSDFYYKLEDLTSKIAMFKHFHDQTPFRSGVGQKKNGLRAAKQKNQIGAAEAKDLMKGENKSTIVP